MPGGQQGKDSHVVDAKQAMCTRHGAHGARGHGAAGARHEGTGACAVHKHGMASGTGGAGALRALLGASAREKGVGTGEGGRRTSAVDKQSKDDSDAVDAKPAMYSGHGTRGE